jgi:hypothetical protein
MAEISPQTLACQPARYQITVRGKIRETWSDWFNGMEISSILDLQGSVVTVLTGAVADQAALRGILGRIWDLNLTVLAVTLMGPNSERIE